MDISVWEKLRKGQWLCDRDGKNPQKIFRVVRLDGHVHLLEVTPTIFVSTKSYDRSKMNNLFVIK